MILQAELNVGILGHVDHGKTTLTHALTGKWTDTHSEEIKRGISIRLGYAEASVYLCAKCDSYSFSEKCEGCGTKGELKRKISFLDAPGHETLMTTAISASSIIDGALFLIAANEQCPQPQTREHLMVLDLLGIKNVIIVQTKIDLVSKEKAIENYNQIKGFLKGTVAENAPIIPVAANYRINLGEIVAAIEKYLPTPKRDKNAKLRMFVSRSFDINKPGTPIPKLHGGIIGGSVVRGSLKVGDKIELRPGIVKKEGAKPTPMILEVVALRKENDDLEEALPGGLVAVGTLIDPALTKSDALIGSVIGTPGELPEPVDTIKLKYQLLKRTDMENPPFKQGEAVVVNASTSTNVGVITVLAKGTATIKLKKLMIVEKSSKVALCRRLGQRWRLAGCGELA